jgi:Cft2 family RNA processing exonuclease
VIDIFVVKHYSYFKNSFHLDHCGAVPYLLEKTSFRGKVYMTYPTKAIFPTVIADSAKVSNPKGENTALFDKNDIKNATSKISLIHYHQVDFTNSFSLVLRKKTRKQNNK